MTKITLNINSASPEILHVYFFVIFNIPLISSNNVLHFSGKPGS